MKLHNENTAAPKLEPPLEIERLDDLTDLHMIKIYRKYEFNCTRAAEALGIGRSTLYRHLRRLGLAT